MNLPITPPARRRAGAWNQSGSVGFTLIELLVVIAIIAILASLVTAGVGRAKSSSRRIVCLNNLRQSHLALHLYSDLYGRYPHQRDPIGRPIPKGEPVWGRPGAYCTNEWNELVRLSVAPAYQFQELNVQRDGTVRDPRVMIFSCPSMAQPWRLPGPDGDSFSVNYVYTGGASAWVNHEGVTDPAYSPFTADDDPTWTLMADFVFCGGPGSQIKGFDKAFNAHLPPNGQSAGANHLFNDGHARWVGWNNGRNMRTNTIWAAGNFYIWRRTEAAP